MWPPNLYTFVGLGFLVILSACAPDNAQVQPDNAQVQVGSMPDPEPARRVVFGPGDFERAAGPFGLPLVAESYWRPSPAEVGRFEVALDSALSAARTEHPDVPPENLASYTVQYVGYVLNGRRRIYANGACRTNADVEKQWVVVFDGGTCYFGVSFDVDAEHLIDLDFNGEA